MEMKKGIFYGVGVGPGDPELMTLKALRIIKECPVLACPQTKGGDTLALDIVKGAADISDKTILTLHFAMSRDPKIQHAAHEKAVDEVCRYLKQGQDVAMPNLGDVSIYSTYCYLMEMVQKRGYEAKMIAGVPSFCAVAARLGISLTEMNTPLHIAPGSSDLNEALHWPGTKILMKSGKQMPNVLSAIDEYASLEKSALVQNCGLPDEKVFSNLKEKAPEAGSGYFATVIVKE